MIGGSQRWAISLADLLMLLLGFFVLLDTSRAERSAQVASVSASIAGARSPVLRADAAALFVPREAMLTDRGRAALRQVGGDVMVRVSARGTGEGRYDGWDLAAARAAAIARTIGKGRAEVELSADAPAGEVLIAPR